MYFDCRAEYGGDGLSCFMDIRLDGIARNGGGSAVTAEPFRRSFCAGGDGAAAQHPHLQRTDSHDGSGIGGGLPGVLQFPFHWTGAAFVPANLLYQRLLRHPVFARSGGICRFGTPACLGFGVAWQEKIAIEYAGVSFLGTSDAFPSGEGKNPLRPSGTSPRGRGKELCRIGRRVQTLPPNDIFS